jgi:3-methyl-2-oxobutanoate hydroxymethyltransferase
MMKSSPRVTLETLRECKREGRKFPVLTCYDAPTARIMDAAGVDVLLVGDTAAEVVLGLPSTRLVRPEYMLDITAAVRRGAPEAFVMADLPYACRADNDAAVALEWARRFMGETGSDAVKSEVTSEHLPMVEAMAGAGVPVVAHIGLLPQMLGPEEAYSGRGKDAESARALIEAARRLEEAGAAALLLEAVASEVAREITRHTELPVIGCVAGPHCDGTVVVLHDMIGWGGGHPPRMVNQYEELSGVLGRAFRAYVEDIRAGRFPSERQAIHMRPGEFERLTALTGER